MTNQITQDKTRQLQEIGRRLEALRAEDAGLRLRDAAERLGICELLAVQADPTQQVTPLTPEITAILQRVPRLGRVMALTRNHAVVHERKGVYENMNFSGHVGLAVGDDIDLRMFLNHWQFALAVTRETAEGSPPARSLQFFDAAGTAVHKIHLLPESRVEDFDALVSEMAAPPDTVCWPSRDQPVLPGYLEGREDGEIDVAGYQAAWDDLRDVHDFHPMTRRFGLAREQALRLAGTARAHRLAPDAWQSALATAAEWQVPVMIFAGNTGCIQIHSGPVRTLRPIGDWFNVLDPDFNLHVRTDLVARCWVIRRPSEDGLITSLEVFDDLGQSLLTLFGKRKPGLPELDLWRDVVDTVDPLAAPAEAVPA
ncbi:MAG: hemin-degrading factor [Halothiobacillaceae bacterium]